MGPTILLLAAAIAAAPLDRLIGRERLLLVFAPRPDAPELVRQRLIDGPEARARDLRVITVVHDEVVGVRDTGTALRRRFGVGTTEFRVVLVGKDGGVKRDDRAPIAAASLFATIDAMPMRRDEMRRRATLSTSR